MNIHISGREPVRHFLVETFRRRFPAHSPAMVLEVFDEVDALFLGEYPGYRACDTKFHDLDHTRDATVAALRIADGFFASGDAPGIDVREYEMVTVATLLHDSGYIRAETENGPGTGAKFTVSHVQRSADFAAEFLLRHHFAPTEIRAIELAIHCTGINVNLNRLAFASERERLIGSILGAGDLIGQMAAPSYPAKLGDLFDEFMEAGIGAYASRLDLMRRTRGFYDSYVQRMLREQWGDVNEYLPQHFDSETNPYEEAILANLAEIDRMSASQ